MDIEKLTLAACTSIQSGKYNDAKIIMNNIPSVAADASAKIFALSKIASYYIAVEKFQEAREAADRIFTIPRRSYGNVIEINNLKLKEFAKIICELIERSKLEDSLTWILKFVGGFEADAVTQVQELSSIASQYIGAGQFQEANSLVSSILVTPVDRVDKVAALTKISQEFLSAGQVNDALQLDRLIAKY